MKEEASYRRGERHEERIIWTSIGCMLSWSAWAALHGLEHGKFHRWRPRVFWLAAATSIFWFRSTEYSMDNQALELTDVFTRTGSLMGLDLMPMLLLGKHWYLWLIMATLTTHVDSRDRSTLSMQTPPPQKIKEEPQNFLWTGLWLFRTQNTEESIMDGDSVPGLQTFIPTSKAPSDNTVCK